MTAYYNEIDPYAAQWLRNLIAAGHIAPGDVDERSIRDVKPDDLRGYTQCHFFAGIGVWSYALRKAGWPDDRAVWTGSCPCQPFSAAGQQAGFEDERHLWPVWFPLIRACRPPVVFGEQVASKDGLAWLDLVHADLEGASYTVRAADTCAAGVGAPHIRQRLYFAADSAGKRLEGQEQQLRSSVEQLPARFVSGRQRNECWNAGKLADANGRDTRAEGLQRGGEHGLEPQDGGADRLEHAARDGQEQRRAEPSRRGATGGCGEGVLGNAEGERRIGRQDDIDAGRRERSHGQASEANGFWAACDWLPCIDGKARPVEPGTFPLAHGAPARVGRLCAYGNAINAEQAAAFIEAADLL